MNKKKRTNINRLGFVDIKMRDDNNETIFTTKQRSLGNGIAHFEKFLEEKFGIKGFSAADFEGFRFPKKKKKKEDKIFW